MLILVKKAFRKAGDFLKLFKATPEPPSGYDMLIDSLHKTSADLQIVYENLQNVVEPDLIDYYIYQAKAVQMRYRFMLGCVKKLEDSYTKNPL